MVSAANAHDHTRWAEGRREAYHARLFLDFDHQNYQVRFGLSLKIYMDKTRRRNGRMVAGEQKEF